MVLPTRRTQPHRKHTGREPGAALDAMLRGRQQGVQNPADYQRMLRMILANLRRG